MIVEYSSNNSGGSWWLSDADWKALERAGWTVKWLADEDREFFKADESGRWLGALARSASKEFDDPAGAIREFESATGQNASDEGCNCCGPPHSFSWEDGYVSGEEVLQALYPGSPTSLREAIEG